MLLTRKDMVDETLRRLGVSGVSTFFTRAKVEEAVSTAYAWARSLYEWPHQERAKKTVTVADQYFYDYPETLLTDSITRIIVDGDLYEIKDFDDFLNYKHQTDGDKTLKIASDYARQFFLYPTPTVSDLTIIVFGLEDQGSDFADDEDTTFFTTAEPAANEAIVKQALAILLPQAKQKKEGQAEESEAIGLLANAYNKLLKRKAKHQRLNKPQFEVPDFFANPLRRIRTRIGNFD